MRLIDADEIKKRERDVVLANGAKHRCFDTTMLFGIPTVDAVEVVRCKNCRWFENDGWGYGNCYRRNVDFLRMSDNGFCSYGERREDGNEPKSV